ncbi:MAG: hypothetical protein S0880_23120 [Actinomycetota bacterium]|nr:hypothetical protein [Actinomycetota bacterium]
MSERPTPVAQWFLTTAVALGVTLGAIAGLTLGGASDIPLGIFAGAVIAIALSALVILASRLGDGHGAGHSGAPHA